MKQLRLLVIFWSFFGGGVALAQEVSLDVAGPLGARSRGTVVTPSARLLEQGEIELSLTHEHDGRMVRSDVITSGLRGPNRWQTLNWLDRRDLATLQIAGSPVRRVELLAQMPYLASQSGVALGSAAAISGGNVFGDLTLGLRLGLIQPEPQEDAFLTAVTVGASLPTGQAGYALTDDKTNVSVAALAGYEIGDWAFTGHVGYRTGERLQIGDHLFGDFASYGVAVARRLGKSFQVHADGLSRYTFGKAEAEDPERLSLEVLGGARYHFLPFYVDLGGGYGVIEAGATPQWRVFFSLGITDVLESRAAKAVRAAQDERAEDEKCPVNESADATRAQPATREQPEEREPQPTEDPQTNLSSRYRQLAIRDHAFFFALNSSEFDPSGQATLLSLARLLVATAEQITLIGHADERGAPKYNDTLSLARATRVRDQLIALGVPEAQLQIRAASTQEPLVSNPVGNDANTLNRSVTVE